MKRNKTGRRYISAIMSAVLVVSLIVPTSARNYFSAYSGESDVYYSDTDFEQGDYGMDGVLDQDVPEGDISTPDAVCEHGDTRWTDNDDGTHDQVCNDCSKHIITSEVHLDADNDGACDRCGNITNQVQDEVCEHKNTRWVSNDDSTHGRVCDDCGERIVMSESHFDYNSDGTCDQCGYVSIQAPEKACDHGYAHWVDNGDGTHDRVCYDCNEHFIVNEAHFDSNDDGVCDKCRSVSDSKPTPECEHVHTNWDDNGNGTHNQVCSDCDECLVENEVHFDNNLDGVCDRCNSIISQASDEECDHPSPRWVDNGDGTHDRICYDCSEHIVAGEAHFDGDGDGACDRCGYVSNLLVAELCEHTNTIWVDNGDETHDQVCEDCNEHIVTGDSHYDGNGDGFCDKCKAVTAQFLIATIPLTLPITANLNGEVAVADNAEIRNLSSTQAIKVTDVRVSVFSGWILVDGDTVFAETDRGAQQLAMGFRGTPVKADGSMDMTQADWSIEANGRLPLNMEASIPAQDQGAAQFTMGKVTFALDWAEGSTEPEPEPEPVGQATTFNKAMLDRTLMGSRTVTILKDQPIPWDGVDISDPQNGTVFAWKEGDDGFINLVDSYLTSTANMFRNDPVDMYGGAFSSLTSIDIQELDTSHVTDMSSMFMGCSNLCDLDVTHFDTRNVTDMMDMFWDCSNLYSLNVSGFDTSKVTNMSRMFEGCALLGSLDVSNFDTSKVTDMGSMFSNCSALVLLDLSNFNTGNVIEMGGMFNNCRSLTSLNIQNFDTSNVTDMSYMFMDCLALSALNVSSFDTSNVTSMHYMFEQCIHLTSLNISNFDISKVTDLGAMFERCSSLTTLYVKDAATKTAIANSGNFPKNCTIIVSSAA